MHDATRWLARSPTIDSIRQEQTAKLVSLGRRRRQRRRLVASSKQQEPLARGQLDASPRPKWRRRRQRRDESATRLCTLVISSKVCNERDASAKPRTIMMSSGGGSGGNSKPKQPIDMMQHKQRRNNILRARASARRRASAAADDIASAVNRCRRRLRPAAAAAALAQHNKCYSSETATFRPTTKTTTTKASAFDDDDADADDNASGTTLKLTTAAAMGAAKRPRRRSASPPATRFAACSPLKRVAHCEPPRPPRLRRHNVHDDDDDDDEHASVGCSAPRPTPQIASYDDDNEPMRRLRLACTQLAELIQTPRNYHANMTRRAASISRTQEPIYDADAARARATATTLASSLRRAATQAQQQQRRPRRLCAHEQPHEQPSAVVLRSRIASAQRQRAAAAATAAPISLLLRPPQQQQQRQRQQRAPAAAAADLCAPISVNRPLRRAAQQQNSAAQPQYYVTLPSSSSSAQTSSQQVYCDDRREDTYLTTTTATTTATNSHGFNHSLSSSKRLASNGQGQSTYSQQEADTTTATTMTPSGPTLRPRCALSRTNATASTASSQAQARRDVCVAMTRPAAALAGPMAAASSTATTTTTSCPNEMDLIKANSSLHLWHWDASSATDLRNCIVSEDKLEVCFHPECSESTVAIRGSRALQRNGNYYYWEVSVYDKTYGTSVMFGLCTKEQSMHVNDYCNLIGLDRNGWSLSHKGLIWHNGQRSDYTQIFPANQSITVGMLFDTMRGELSYYMDGRCLGVAFYRLNACNQELYPAIGSTAKNTRMRLMCSYCGHKSLLERSCFSLLKQVTTGSATNVDSFIERLKRERLPLDLVRYLADTAHHLHGQEYNVRLLSYTKREDS